MLTLGQTDVLTPSSTRWQSVLQRVRHDIFHTPEYHTVPGFGQRGEPQAFVYEEDDLAFLWPYLLSPIPGTDGCNDVTSVYGYPGPVGSADAEFLARAWQALLEHWRTQRVVSAFTRFHPLLANCQLLAGIPEAAAGIRAYGSTVSIDLTLSDEAQVKNYKKNLRQQIRKAREAGFSSFRDEEWNRADEFVAVYQDTMARLSSRPDYLVDRAWVDRVRETLGANVHLFVTKSEDDVVAAAMIVFVHGTFLHCHLIGSNPQFFEHSPTKVLLDDVRIWGTRHGYSSMHLGGGLGGREDSLFHFKSRFSPVTHPFHTGSWILDEVRYRQLETEHLKGLAGQGVDVSSIDYFPSYRFTPHAPSDGIVAD
jgi:hypothetical protein